MPVPVIIIGALGRMGVEIAGLVTADPFFRLHAAVERPDHPRQGTDYGLCMGKESLGIQVSSDFDDTACENGVIIDFSSPQSTTFFLEKACNRFCRMVVGTTGLSAETYALAEKASKRSALLVSPNMSVGVNLLFLLTELVSARLKNDFDIEIVEAHHRFKKDSPSGTARRLGEIAAQAIGTTYDEAVRNGRSGMASGDRSRQEVGMHALRGGDIVGDHTVLFAGIGERIELRHMMHSRTTLARGAVTAARWISEQKPGNYTMRDVLGL